MKKALPHILLLLLAISVYIGSEMVMRRQAYPAKQQSADEDLNRLLSNLPSPVSSWVQNRRKVQQLQAEIAQEADPEKKADLYFKLIGMVGEGEQYDCYQAIVKLIPHSPKTSRAWAALLGSTGSADDVDIYLTYIEGCQFDTPDQRVTVWLTGWAITQKSPVPTRLKFLDKMATAEIVSSSLVDPYEQMGILARLNGRNDLVAVAKKRLVTCQELLRADQDMRH